MNVAFSENWSKVFFILVFLISAAGFGIGGYLRRHVSAFLSGSWLFLSFLVLFIPLGFRTVGIDHDIYVEWFENADYWLRVNYHWTPEPLFAALTLFSKETLHYFQFIYLFAAAVYLFGTIRFLDSEKSLGFLSVLFMSVSLYLYMCGLARISIAIGIISFAYTKMHRKGAFLFLMILATLFHYSAAVTILVYFAYRSKKGIAAKGLIYLIGGITILSILITRLASSLPYALARYASYVEMHFDIRNITSVIILIPAMILWFVCKGNYANLYGKRFLFYDNTIKLLVILVFFSMSFNGLFRLTFYFYPIIAKVYADFSRVMIRNRHDGMVLVYSAAFALAGILYVYAVFFSSPFITHLIIPFSM